MVTNFTGKTFYLIEEGEVTSKLQGRDINKLIVLAQIEIDMKDNLDKILARFSMGEDSLCMVINDSGLGDGMNSTYIGETTGEFNVGDYVPASDNNSIEKKKIRMN